MTKKLAAALVLMALMVAGFADTASAQANRGQERKEDPKLREREKARADRDARRYDKLRAFALNLYQTDLDFRDDRQVIGGFSSERAGVRLHRDHARARMDPHAVERDERPTRGKGFR